MLPSLAVVEAVTCSWPPSFVNVSSCSCPLLVLNLRGSEMLAWPEDVWYWRLAVQVIGFPVFVSAMYATGPVEL